MNHTFLKNIALSILLIGLVFSPLSLLPTKSAQAIPVEIVGEVPLLPSVVALQKIALNTTVKNIVDARKEANSFLLSILKKRILDVMVDDIITWIQGGGEPRFITNWNAFLDDAVNVAIGDFAQEIGAGYLCQPFSTQLQIALNPVKRFSEAITCTLDDIVGNIENFYQDFANGGWIAYQSSLELQNNFYGSYFLAQEERDRRIARAQFEALEDARAGGGFLSQRDANGNIVTPGSTIGGLVKEAIGADFKFIVNADQLSDYVASIADALINRIIREGVNGLRGLTTRSNPGPDFVARGNTRCTGLSGELLIACQAYTENNDNIANTLNDFLLETVREAIDVRLDLIVELAGLKTLWEDHLAFLEDRRAIQPSCVLDSELSGARDAIIDLGVRIGSVEIAIEALEALTTQTGAGFFGSSGINQDLITSPYLNISDIQNEIDSISEDGGEKDDLEETLEGIESEVQSCSGTFGSGSRS
ncbi:MAG: hypothetical protein Q8P45_02130 [Candidatus Harrisonbacteria bacterium]|nr:hypothetical protein [Candidatus Harrisonbacteria bacterium]